MATNITGLTKAEIANLYDAGQAELKLANEENARLSRMIEEMSGQDKEEDGEKEKRDARIAELEAALAESEKEKGTLQAKITDLELGSGNDDGEEARQLREKVAILEADNQALKIERDDFRNKTISLQNRLVEQGSLHGTVDNLRPVV